MEQYIPKATLVAEIEKYYNECLKRAKITDSDYWNAKADAYRNVLVILDDNLEVKEVDLSLIEPHIKEVWNKINTGHTYSIIDSYNIFVGICTYFYELGLKAQKGSEL